VAKKYALLIGNDRYSEFPDLKVPAADVAGLRRVLADPGIGGFGDEVRVLMNPDLRPAQEAISELFARRTRDDLVLLYFSGHGEPDRGKRGALYLALPESRRDRLRATALPCDFIKTELDECQAGRQVLILDCCYAGAIGEKGGAIDPACFGDLGQPSPAAGVKVCNGYGRVTLTSSTATQTSWEGNQVIAGVARSLFTHFLIQGLETGEAAEGRPHVNIGQLYRYAHDRVVAATAAAGGKRMDPQCWVHRQQGELIIARNPRPPVVPPDPKDLLDADLLADLACGNHRTRVGSVRELARLMRRPDLTAAVRGVLRDRLAAERDFEVRALIDEALALAGSVPIGSIAAPVGGARSAVRTAAPAADAVPGNTIADTAPNPLPRPRDAPSAPLPLVTRPSPDAAFVLHRRGSRWWIPALVGVLVLVAAAVLLSQRLAAPVSAVPSPWAEAPDVTPVPASMVAVAASIPPAAAPPLPSPGVPACGQGTPLSICRDILKDGSPGPAMVIIPAGSFLAVSPEKNEPKRIDYAKQHRVEIKQPFAIGKLEITVAQFRRFVEANEGYQTEAEKRDGCDVWKDGAWVREYASWRTIRLEQSDDLPVVCVSLKDVWDYTAWLSKQTGKAYRIPTDSEWEYAARAGATTPSLNGDCMSSDQANGKGTYDYNGCGLEPDGTSSVGSRNGNSWGLFDMDGNVWEWTCLAYDDYKRGSEKECFDRDIEKAGLRVAVRGGGRIGGEDWSRYMPFANRSWIPTSNRSDDLGFRLAQDL